MHIQALSYVIEWHERDWVFKTNTGELIEASPQFPPVQPIDLHELNWPKPSRKHKKPAPLDAKLDYPRALKDMLWHGRKQSLNHNQRCR